MKVQVIYSSLTGCTKKVAESIYNSVEADEKTIHNLKDGIPVLDGDIIIVGYWVMGSGPNGEMKEFLKTIKGKAVGIFSTLGFYADTDYGHNTVKAGIDLVKENNTIIGGYVCNGAIAKSLQTPQKEGQVPKEQKEIRWEVMKNHPTEAECALAGERFKERVEIYKQCKEYGIEFQNIM